MHRLAELFHRTILFITPIAERLGGPGLAMVSFLDSSLLSLPEIADALIILLVIQHPARWLYYGAMTTVGSVAGCYVLYLLARKGGEAFLRKRLSSGAFDRGLNLFRRYGLLMLIVPSILPPPMPFKLFVLLAGVAGVSAPTFIIALTVGRGFRYVGEAWLAYRYGEQATAYIQDNLPKVSIAAAVVVVLIGVAVVIWRRRGALVE
jgi:membrane protein YqaA with SNARE-associated domain